MSISVITVDDHLLIREGIRSLLAGHADVELVGEGACGEDLWPLLQAHQPDVLLLDLGMPRSLSQPDGERFLIFPAMHEIHRDYPQTQIIIVSQHLAGTLVEGALQAGVRGYLVKDDALTGNLVDAIRTVHAGGAYFSAEVQRLLAGQASDQAPSLITQRQREILFAVAARPDRLQSEHAKEFGISEHTLKRHLQEIYRALDVTNLTAAIVRGIQLNIVSLSVLEAELPVPQAASENG